MSKKLNLKKIYYKEKSYKVLNLLFFKIKFRTSDFLSNNKIVVLQDGKEHLIKNLRKLKNIKINIEGEGNKIILSDYSQASNCKIVLNGNCNEVIIESNELVNTKIELNSSKSYVKIDKNVILRDFYVVSDCGNNQKLTIGRNTTSYSVNVFLNEENAALHIGENCMLSGEIVMWPTDGHAIIDNATNKVINLPTPLVIGNNCWIGYGAFFTKNGSIADNTVVAAKSVVSKKFDEKSIIIAGNPARIIKRNTRWDRDNASSKIKTMLL